MSAAGVLSLPLMDEAAAADLPRRVRDYARQEELFRPGDRVLAAVSGGPDSVALLHLLARLSPELGLKLGVGHFDHGLRPDSGEDARFVAQLAGELKLPFHSGRGEVRALARAEKISLQMAARRLRLGFLKETCHRQAYEKLALGHTADDQVELFFLRLLRGAGPEGLKGMWPATPAGLVRPLLCAGKAVLLAWLRQEGLSWRQDPGNLNRDFLRVRVREDLLGELRRYNPRLTEAVWRTQALLQEEERLLAREAARAWEAVATEVAPDFYALNLQGLLGLEPALVNRVLRSAVGRILEDHALTAAQVAGLLELARGGRSGGIVSLRECRVARAGPELHVFRRLPAPPREALPLPDPPGRAEALGWRWELSGRGFGPEAPGPRPETACLDRDKVTLPLEVRHFRPGDRFWPRGGPGPRKLQDFLVDRKIPRWLRPHLPLVAGPGGILWVPGLEAAEPARVTPETRAVVKITLAPATPHTRRVWEALLAWRRRGGQAR